MKAVINFSKKIIDHQTIIITILAAITAYLRYLYGFYANLPSGLIGVAIIFPIVILINSAYERLEEALKYFVSLRTHAIAIYYAHHDWVPDNPEHAQRVKHLISSLLGEVKAYFLSTTDDEQTRFQLVYARFSEFSLSHEQLRMDIPVDGIEINSNGGARSGMDRRKLAIVTRNPERRTG